MTTSEPARLIPAGDIRAIVELGAQLQVAASKHNIHNVFDDGGYKELLLLRLFNLTKLEREGDDAIDPDGRRYEIKTVARVSSRGVRKASLQVTTEHTLTLANIERYRKTFLWIVAVFDQAQPEAIYEVDPHHLEPYFSTWERRLLEQEALKAEGGAPVHLNNPKIPLSHIENVGLRVWPAPELPLPTEAAEGLGNTEDLRDEP